MATVRGLGRAGWRVIVAGGDPKDAALAATSKYVEAYHRIPDPRGEAAPVEAALQDVVRRRGCRAVVICYDGTIARLRGLNLGVPTVPILDDALDRLIDKANLAVVCSDAGVIYPRTWLADGTEPIPVDQPLIVKPRRTAVARPDRVVSLTGASVTSDRRELDSAVTRVRAAGLEPIVQLRVERASKVNVSIVRRAGYTSFQIAYKVLREFPPEGGRAAATETLDPVSGIGARALAAAERVCDAADYAGLANVEFYVQNDGELCLIEVNTRVWGSVWLPEVLGLRAVDRAVQDALGHNPQPPLPYQAGRRFHRPTLELQWFLSSSPERGPRRQLLGSIGPSDVFDLLSASDPMPVAAYAGTRLTGAVQAFIAALIRRGR